MRRVWQFWKGFRGAVTGLCTMCPVLPSLLCQQQSNIKIPCFIAAFSHPIETKFLFLVHRSPRRSYVRAGAVWNVLFVKYVEKPRTRPVFCFAMTAMSVITPIAWTHPCTMFRRVAGSANGKDEEHSTFSLVA